MDIPALLAKIVGIVLLIWTIMSIVRHFRARLSPSPAPATHQTQSLSEQMLNGLLLYLWLAFMLAFSIGMIVNN